MHRHIVAVTLCVALLSPGCRRTTTVATSPQLDKPSELTTKLQALLAERGKTFIKEFHPLGEKIDCNYGDKLDLATISVYETRLEEFRLQGLRVTITENRRYGNQGVSFLDAEEVAEFAQALANMMRLVAEWSGTDKEYTEVEFMTISGFCIGFYQEGRKTCGYAKTGALGTTSAYFPVQRLDVIKAQADEALRLLLPVQSTPQPKGIKGKTAWGLK